MRRTIKYSATILCALTVSCNKPSGAIEQPALIEDDTSIEYPVGMWDQGVEGETEVMIHVTDIGGVDSVIVSKSSGITQLDSAAVAGARTMRFTPGRRGDRRVAMWTRMPIRFRQDSTTVGVPLGSGQ